MRPVLPLAAAALAATLAATAAAGVRPAENGAIAFVRYLRQATTLYTVDPTTKRQAPLVSGGTYSSVAWSPDGRRVAFGSTRPNGTRGLFVADARGRGAVPLTRHRQSASRNVFDDPQGWSPDGRLIVFQRTVFGKTVTNELFVIGADGRGLRRLARNAFAGSWAPDGRSIAFSRTRPGDRHPDLYVVRADGTNVRRLTRTPVLETTPSWSPDGTTIAFTRRRFDGDYDIFTMRADGTEVHRLTWLDADDYGATWSPDGRKIAFASKRVRGQFDIFVMDANGMNQRRLTRNPEDDTDPDWQPLPR